MHAGWVNLTLLPAKGGSQGITITSYITFLHNGFISQNTKNYMTTKETHKPGFSQMTPAEKAEAIKNNAKKIRESAIALRETVKALRESGALQEIGAAIHEASVAARDTAREIEETSKELEQKGIIKETAAAIEETSQAARHAAERAMNAGGSVSAEAESAKEKKGAESSAAT